MPIEILERLSLAREREREYKMPIVVESCMLQSAAEK